MEAETQTPSGHVGEITAAFMDYREREAPEARTLYEEWSEIPSREVLERQSESV